MSNRRIRIWRPTAHFEKIRSEGRNRPPPSIGSPTMVWHLGIWRKRNHAKSGGGLANTEQYLLNNRGINRAFFDEIAGFLLQLQQRGLLEGVPVQELKLEPIILEGDANTGGQDSPRRFEVFRRQSMSFVLWWRADAVDGKENTRSKAGDAALQEAYRVFVQFQSYHDHVTLTFYIDAAKLHGGNQIHAPIDGDLGQRRSILSSHLEAIRKCSHDEIVSGRVDASDILTPENPGLDEAVKYFYEDTWKDFQAAFGFETSSSGPEMLKHGVVFVNQVGLMMSMRGLETPEDHAHREATRKLVELNGITPRLALDGDRERSTKDAPWRPYARSANATLGPVDVFDEKSGEPGVVLRSLWPLLSRMSPGAASKDWVGSGILDWRALFVSPLGSQPQDWDATENHKPQSATDGPTLEHSAERFFVVTKGEPHRRQIGRMIERILALETMRAFALKNLGVIHNSHLYLQVLTTQLDDLLQQWSARRKTLETEHGGFKDRSLSPKPPSKTDNRPVFAGAPSDSESHQAEIYYRELSKLNSENETRLIQISAEIEIMGPGGSGHLAYSIDRASYFIDEFDRMVPSLEIGNVPGWTNYAQFADRGMRPTFNMIKTTGARLRAANDRLKALTDVVQVSALIVQSDATRRNTDVLRNIGTDIHKLYRAQMWLSRFLGFGGAAILVYGLNLLVRQLWPVIGKWFM